MNSFNHGFLAGLQLVKSVLEYIDYDMKIHKRKHSHKEYLSMINCIIANRQALRDNPDTFVRCRDSGGYEVFDGKAKEVVSNDSGTNS